MEITLHEITIADLVDGYVDEGESGVFALNENLTIRPPYQREMVYTEKQQVAVMDSIMNDYPINVMYWMIVEKDEGGEPMNYLKQELREPKVYNNILDAIARGASRNNDIAMKVHLASGALNKYLQQLIDLGIVVKETPVGGKSSRRSIYRIHDGSFRFWYRFVFPNSSVIQLGQGQRLYREYIKSSLSEYMGEGFEEIFFDFFDWMNEKGTFPVLMTQRGRWWGNNPAKKREEEIDLVGMGENTVVLGEVKWRKEQTNMAVLKNLMEKGHFFEAEEKYFLLFSKNGFTKDVREYAAKEPTIILKDFLAET